MYRSCFKILYSKTTKRTHRSYSFHMMENVYFGAAKLTLDEITFACRDLLPLDYSWWIAKHTHVSASHATPFQRPSKSQRNGIHCHLEKKQMKTSDILATRSQASVCGRVPFRSRKAALIPASNSWRLRASWYRKYMAILDETMHKSVYLNKCDYKLTGRYTNLEKNWSISSCVCPTHIKI